jgi:hypothetical protein
VIIAMIAVRMVQASVHQVVDMVAEGYRFVPAIRTVLVRAMEPRRALVGVCRVDGDDMLIHVVGVHVMEVAIMTIVDVTIMTDAGVSAPGAMLVGVVVVVLLGAFGHWRHSMGSLDARHLIGQLWMSCVQRTDGGECDPYPSRVAVRHTERAGSVRSVAGRCDMNATACGFRRRAGRNL